MKSVEKKEKFFCAVETDAYNFLSERLDLSDSDRAKSMISLCERYIQIGMYKNAIEIYDFILFLSSKKELKGLDPNMINEINRRVKEVQEIVEGQKNEIINDLVRG